MKTWPFQYYRYKAGVQRGQAAPMVLSAGTRPDDVMGGDGSRGGGGADLGGARHQGIGGLISPGNAQASVKPAAEPLSKSLAALRLLRDRPSTTSFLMVLPPVGSETEKAARLLTTLVDALESFWEDAEIKLTLLASNDDVARVNALIPAVPRLKLCVAPASEFLSQAADGAVLRDAEALARLLLSAAAVEQSDIACLLSFSAFPIRPCSTYRFVERCIQAEEDKIMIGERAATGAAGIEQATGIDPVASLPPVGLVLPLEAAEVLAKKSAQSFLAQLQAVDLGQAIVQSIRLGGRAALSRTGMFDECVERAGRGWAKQPWKDEASPFFLHVDDADIADPEPVASYIYATLPR
jgi:hypothetical protein